MIRQIVHIDEEKCDGCGLCVPACHEGAIRIVHGKARLVADKLCDGLGACLGHCPKGAIRIEQRDADVFDEAAVESHLAQAAQKPRASTSLPIAAPAPTNGHIGGCPGSRLRQFAAKPAPTAAKPLDSDSAESTPSELTHWPVQLRLLPPNAPALRGAKLLVCADCVPFAYADFHRDLLRGHAVVIACPKLDDTAGYVEKLAQMIALNDLQEITVARMQVPCCGGILQAVLQARQIADHDVPIVDLVVGVEGGLLARHRINADGAATPV